MNVQRTLILVKPDAFARGLTGEILARFERKGLKIAALRSLTVERELAERHYAEHAERPFFGELVDFITSGPLVAMVLEGHEAIVAARQVIGATNPLEAATGQHPRRLRPADRARTWSTARTRRPRPSARRRCSSRTSPSPLAGPRPLVLASGSPQRRAILERVGVPFTRARPRGGRARAGRGGRADARQRARQGPRRAAAAASDETVLGCDTVVTLDGAVFGKPADRGRRS